MSEAAYAMQFGYCMTHGSYWFLCKSDGCIHHYHRCMRCLLVFQCKNEGRCEAQYDVLPSIVVDGQIVEHCPRDPDWKWIREYGPAIAHQFETHEGLPTDHPERCLKLDGHSFRCHKERGHEGDCSCHNDCGAEAPNHLVCGFGRRHAGKHSWAVIQPGESAKEGQPR